MGFLKIQGFTTFYLEHVPLSLQPHLDAYILGAGDTKMPFLLKCFLENRDEGYGISSEDHNFLKLIEAAKKHKMRIIVFETETSYQTTQSNLPGHTPYRLWMMNYSFMVRFLEEPPQGKPLSLVGYKHLTKHEKVAGLKELLGALSARITSNNYVSEGAQPDLVAFDDEFFKVNDLIKDL